MKKENSRILNFVKIPRSEIYENYEIYSNSLHNRSSAHCMFSDTILRKAMITDSVSHSESVISGISRSCDPPPPSVTSDCIIPATDHCYVALLVSGWGP